MKCPHYKIKIVDKKNGTSYCKDSDTYWIIRMLKW